MDIQSSIQIPSKWLKIKGEDTLSGPGYTRWRKWQDEKSVLAVLRQTTIESTQETTVARIVGLYLHADFDEAVGLLVRKRLKADWSQEDKLVILDRITQLYDLDANNPIVGDGMQAIANVIQSMHDQLNQSRVTKDSGVKLEDKYLKEIMTILARPAKQLNEAGLAHFIDNHLKGNPDVVSRIKDIAITASNELC